MVALTSDKIQQALKQLQFNWELIDDKLMVDVTTEDFKEALWLINEIGQVAEELNHHPDLSLHDYKQVRIETTTHAEGAITDKDLALAERVDAILTRLQ